MLLVLSSMTALPLLNCKGEISCHYVVTGQTNWHIKNQFILWYSLGCQDQSIFCHQCNWYIRLTLTGEEFWLVKNSHAQKMQAAEMKMLRWMRGNPRRDKEWGYPGQGTSGRPLDKMREVRLRRFGHVKRRCLDAQWGVARGRMTWIWEEVEVGRKVLDRSD